MSGCGKSGTFCASHRSHTPDTAAVGHTKRYRRSGESTAPARVLDRNPGDVLKLRVVIARRSVLPRIPGCNQAGPRWRR